MDYTRDYVALPKEYGTPGWFARPDIAAIRKTVRDNLEELRGKTGFTERLQGRTTIIKPNLVSVWHNAGFVEMDYPNTTDPRVLDAVIEYLQDYTKDIVIAESSGRGMPTLGSFMISGIDRLAKYRGARLVSLEEEPVQRYYLPRAQVMKDVFLPRIFTKVVEGEAFYISMPKMKTNMYTKVTLGFKNGMGCIPYNLRQRNHNHDLEQKLVDMLWLFRPDMVIIDGIVGAEGQCPGPVDPVDSRVIISGDNSVETDRVATQIMGFDPNSVKLMQLADAQGFGCPDVEVSGDTSPIEFKPADPSLLGPSFTKLFPNVRALVGHSHRHAPQPGTTVDQDFLHRLEMSCRGGCLTTARLGFEFLHYEGLNRDFELTIIVGAGCSVNGERVWFDHAGKSYTVSEIAALPGTKLAVGNCALGQLEGKLDHFIPGCMVFPNSVHMKLHKLTKLRCRVVNPFGPAAPALLKGTLRMRRTRRKLLRQGQHLDWWPDLPEIDGLEKSDEDWVKVDLPPLSKEQIRERIRAEWQEVFDLIV
jgi:uncharacterized protein (DUF362 family)